MTFRSALVTGATGFLGSVLVPRLIKENVEVTCLVRSKTRATGLLGLTDINIIEVASLRKDDLAAELANFSVDVVFHLASYGVQQPDRNPELLVDGNVGIITALLELATKWQIKRFIHAGSCSEYGIPLVDGVPMDENHPLNPTSLYGAAKAAAFVYGNSLARDLEIPFLTLRLFGVFGPHEAPHRLVPYLIECLSNGRSVDLTPGEQVRDFLFEDDAVEAFVEAASADELDFYEAYNICSSIPVTIRSVGEMVASKLNRPHELLHWGERQYRTDEPMWLVGDNRYFVNSTSWRARISMEEGIERMIVGT